MLSAWMLPTWFVFMLGLVVSVGIYLRVVLPTLRAKGLMPDPPHKMSGREWSQIRQYKRACEMDGLSLAPYRALISGQVVALAAFVLWVVLLLADRPG